ncbi:NitT/TauT family transport system substrate-binding protein [Amycolatopsis lexingtonensis]|uniref:NitT/TauT family transport system substrate-binding protein n=2 Tax=Amycolatopsis lexingtonensis TaxID=218822 RepID=A0ABR9IBJ9_9PSEU|nr:ABC transporter substrate-binding protein [Amycolatopsis lexingtonensis]MBE1500534.1 NitT/TauT family transport system substrate-binding protein [Amycolatopsis lexingtonensis]
MVRAVLAGLLALLLTGCSALDGSSPPSAAREKLRVSMMSTIDTAPFWLAKDSGYFEREGLDVSTIEAATGQASLTKLVSGEADIAYSSYTPFFVARSKGTADIRLVADASSAGPRSTGVVALPASGIRSVADLAGKRIGISAPNTIADTLTKSVLADNHVDTAGVKWVPLPLPNTVAALKNGDIDAAFLTEPFITQASRSAGAVLVADTGTGSTVDFPTAGYGALGAFTSASPRAVAAFQRAMAAATRDAAADRKKIEPLMVKYAKIDAATAASTGLLTLQSTLDARRLQRVPDLLLKTGVLTTPVDVAAMVVR